MNPPDSWFHLMAATRRVARVPSSSPVMPHAAPYGSDLSEYTAGKSPLPEFDERAQHLYNPIIPNMLVSELVFRTKLGTRKGPKRDMHSAGCSLSSLRFALNHFYDLRALKGSPLAAAIDLRDSSGAPEALRSILADAIDSLKPDATQPMDTPMWRAYEILYYRYIQQCTQQEVADQLGISVRHLKREQRKALEMLAQRLSERHSMAIVAAGASAESTARGDENHASVGGGDLRWLKDTLPNSPVDLCEALPAVRDLVRPMALAHGVSLRLADMSGLPVVAVHAVALRQILLSLLNVAICRIAQGQLTVSARQLRWQVELRLASSGAPRDAQRGLEDETSLRLAQQMAASCGAALTVAIAKNGLNARLLLPAAEQVPVLVIDDNADAQSLLKRYALGTRYRIVTELDPKSALSVASEVSPEAIVLDVMMPEVDGWELLGRLRQHPVTNRTPVIACTILSQEELAFSLGVDAYLQKPVSRQSFLETLDRLVFAPKS